MMNFSQDGSIDTVEFYGNKFDSILVDFKIFIGLVLILAFVFSIRFLILRDIEKDKSKRKKLEKSTIAYIISHTLMELLLSFLLSYIIIKLTNANPESYIINFVAAPAFGTLASVYLDNKILMPLESNSAIGGLYKKKKSSESKKDDSNSGNTININIDNSKDDDNDTKNHHVIHNSNNKDLKLLNESDIDSEDFNLKVVEAINSIKNEQFDQGNTINENSVKLEDTIESINILRETEIVNKRIELKKMIYDCLNQGYAKPDQNDKITSFYHAYRKLDGNHEMESLYEEHYLKLGVHEDRRINQQKTIDNDRRDPNKRKFTYGQFDNEYTEKTNEE